MRWVLCVLALAAVTMGMARADDTDLRDGVLIAHAPAGMEFTTIAPEDGWCAEYMPYAIYDAEDQVNRIDASDDPSLEIWFVLAAWSESKTLCGVQFGLSDYDNTVFPILDFGACGTDPQSIPTTDPAWPNPLSGIAVAWAVEDALTGNYIPVYYFGGYAYQSYGSTQIELVPDPSMATPFRGFASCANPPVVYDADGGAMGINTDGIYAEPVPPPPIRACCDKEDFCTLLTADDCDAAGGDWLADSTACHNPGTCAPIGACCFGSVTTTCQVQTQAWCEDQPNFIIWYEGIDCDPDPCEPIPQGSCCVGDVCTTENEEDCGALGGEWTQGESCTPNPCVPWYACCHDGECDLYPQDYCEGLGGTWFNGVTECDEDMCDEGACCIEGNCFVLTRHECSQGAGLPTFHEGLTCEWQGQPRDCAEVASCCIQHICYLMFMDECLNHPDVDPIGWHPLGDCDELDPCVIPATDSKSWGEIKKLYR